MRMALQRTDARAVLPFSILFTARLRGLYMRMPVVSLASQVVSYLVRNLRGWHMGVTVCAGSLRLTRYAHCC